MRTQEPPAIFQPSAMTTYNPLKALQQRFINMAYKHPQQLFIGEKDECDFEHEMMNTENYNDPNKYRSFKLNIFNSNNENTTTTKPVNTECRLGRLIGNVKPNLIKTWEQLNAMTSQSYPKENNEQMDERKNQISQQNIIYFGNNDMLFDQKMPTIPKNNESFVIKRPASQSGHFYDSIDNESVVTQDDDEQLITSLCADEEHGGEAMAEYISLIEKKEKLCWSIDSCN